LANILRDYIHPTMSVVSYLIVDPVDASYEDGSANTTANNAGWILVRGSTIRIKDQRTPSSASADGYAGEICYDANYIYVCTAANTWKRIALSSW
jgi:hypothetical protein